MARGVKIADVWVEATLDKSGIRSEAAALSGELAAEGDRAGKSYGQNLSKSLAGQVEQLSARLAKARLQEQKATDSVTLAEQRLSEARENEKSKASTLLALEQRLSQSQSALAIAHDNTAKAATRHADAERRLATDIENLGKATGPAADKAGRDTGDKLSQGIHMAIIRNSPLIAAGIGAALAAGAPVAIAGATLLFAGIAVAAASMNDEVQKHWSAAWQSIVTGTKQDAIGLQQTVANMADQLAKGFDTLRPALRSIFADMAPLLHDFTDSLITMARNAMPGLVSAVQSAGPVMSGLGSLMQSIGTGISGFFEEISKHSGAAGQVFASLGQAVQSVLPALGTLLGAGTEVASHVLPIVTSALGALSSAVQFAAPALPAIGEGLLGFKVGDMAAGWLGKAAGAVGSLGDAMGGGEEGAGAFSSALSFVGDHAQDISEKAGPILGAVIGGVTIVLSRAAEQTQQWAQALVAGGAAADTARAQMSNFGTAMQTTNSGLGGIITGLVGFGAQAGVTGKALGDVKGQQDAITASLTPMQAAQQAVTTAQNNLNLAVDRYGATSPQAASASATLSAAQAEVAAQSNATELAIEGVTDAMLAQANQALAAASSSFAYDSATQQVADAQSRLHDLQVSGTATTSDLNNATNSLNQALLSQAEAAGRLAADSLPSTASATDKAAASDTAMLQELYKLRDTMGSQFPVALQQAIVGLENSGAATARAGGQAVTATGQTGGLIQQMIALGQLHPTPAIAINNQASVILASIKSQIDNIQGKTVTITTVYRQSGITAGAGMTTIRANAMGGPVDAVIKAASGRVVGPGTGTSDSVPAIGPAGQPWRLSNGEWVVRDAAVRALEAQYGKAAMPAINSGRLPVATGSGSSGSMVKVPGGAMAGGNTYNFTLNVYAGVGADGRDIGRTALRTIQQGLRRLDRETS